MLTDLKARGIDLQAHGDRLRYRPRSAMTPELRDRLRACKADLLAILAGKAPEPNAGASPQPEPDVPQPPAARAGYIVELTRPDGRWAWRQRRMDDADRVYAAYAGRA